MRTRGRCEAPTLATSPKSGLFESRGVALIGVMLALVEGCVAGAKRDFQGPPPGEIPPSSLSNEQISHPLPPPSAEEQLTPAERLLHIEDALSELTEAEHAVDRELRRVPPGGRRTELQPPPVFTPGSPKTRPAQPCEVLCVALASMGRSANYLCKLAGASDSRCVSARDRFRRASDRVTTTCGACAEGGTLSMLHGETNRDALCRLDPGYSPR